MDVEIEELLTVQQAARLFHRREETVRGWIHAGKLPASRLPCGSYRIKKADLMALLQPVPPIGTT